MTTSKCLFSILLLSTVFSCKDDFDPITDLNGTRNDITAMLQATDITQRATVDSDNFVFRSAAGTLVKALPNSFVFDDGTIATGMIDFELTELFAKSEILQYGIPTMTYDGEILESDGEFLFAASQNGNALELANEKVLQLLVPNDDPNSGMQLFRPIEGLWGLTESPVNVIEVSDTTETFWGYETFPDRLAWVNIDYFTKFDLALTDVSICLPEDYKDSAVITWVVFKNLDIVLSTDGRNLPIGEEIYVVCISAENEDTFRLDIQEVTVEVDLKVNLDPKRTSEEDIKKRIKELD